MTAAASALLRRALAPYSASGWADGLLGAPAGRPQYPWLLAGYGPNRPPWNVAGVDYHAGIPEGVPLTDWRTLSDPQLSVNTSTGLVRVDGIAGGSYTFRNVDFSLGIGALLYNSSGGASRYTFINCKFGLPVGSPASGAFTWINDQNAADITILNCRFNGENGTGSFVSCAGNVTMKYNWFVHSPSRIIEWNVTISGKTVTYQYNFVDDSLIAAGGHQNYLQNSCNTTVKHNVAFNTTIQKSLGGAEGFQFLSNATGMVLQNPVFTNNTMIARPALGTQTMSYMIHGTAPANSTVSGTGLNNNNYFDHSGAFGAYYPGTVIPSLGWSSSGNIDMNTGATITPA